MTRCVLALATISGLLGCSAPGRREASALIEAVDRYRRADNPSKFNQAQAVGAVSCSATAVCAAKRICLDAINPTTHALSLKDEVAARLGDIEQRHLDPRAPEAASLADKLDEAARLLEIGRAKMTECERRLADLRLEFGS
jgi:hypothetical protein